MKSKIFNLFLLALLLNLNGCNNNPSTSNVNESSTNDNLSYSSSSEEMASSVEHVHNCDENFSYNEIYHFKECRECHEILFKGMHDLDNGVCQICYYVDENLVPKDFIPIDKYFSKAKYVYDRNDYVYDENNNKVEFNTLLDRQISVFTQDIMYRLSYVYGSNGTTHNRSKNAIFELKNNDNTPYTFNNIVAKVSANSLLTGLDIVNENDDLSSALINNISYYQRSISLINTEKNCLLSAKALNLAGAIDGRNMRIIKNNDSYLLDNNINTSAQWVFGSGLKDSTYHTFANKRNFNDFKMAMAQIMANEDIINGAYEINQYNNLLNRIDNMQISVKYKDALWNYIKNYVIGRNLVLNDDNYANILNETYDSLISDGNINLINRTTLFNSFNVSTDSLRLYKGYSVVIPSLIAQALSNSFDAFNTNPLYPYLSRNNVELKDILDFRQKQENYKSVVLIPGLNEKETSLSEIGITLLTTEKYLVNLNQLYDNPTQEITVNISYVINDKLLGIDSKKITLSPDDTVKVIIFDVKSFTKGMSFDKYLGNINDFSNDKLFENSFAIKQNSDYDAGSYIKISFENETKSPFNIYLNGYYE